MTDDLGHILELVLGLLASVAGLLYCAGGMERWMTQQITVRPRTDPASEPGAVLLAPPAVTPAMTPVAAPPASLAPDPLTASGASRDDESWLLPWIPEDLATSSLASLGAGGSPRHARQ